MILRPRVRVREQKLKKKIKTKTSKTLTKSLEAWLTQEKAMHLLHALDNQNLRRVSYPT